MPQSQAVATHRDVILARLAQGDLVRDIAQDLGINRVSISQALAKDPDYKAAQIEAVEARLEQAEADLRAAHDGLSLGKHRELLSHARWRAAVTVPHIYAPPKQSVQVNSDGPTSIQIVSYRDEEPSA